MDNLCREAVNGHVRGPQTRAGPVSTGKPLNNCCGEQPPHSWPQQSQRQPQPQNPSCGDQALASGTRRTRRRKHRRRLQDHIRDSLPSRPHSHSTSKQVAQTVATKDIQAPGDNISAGDSTAGRKYGRGVMSKKATDHNNSDLAPTILKLANLLAPPNSLPDVSQSPDSDFPQSRHMTDSCNKDRTSRAPTKTAENQYRQEKQRNRREMTTSMYG